MMGIRSLSNLARSQWLSLCREYTGESRKDEDQRKPRLLATFDFDKTIINEDSYTALGRLLPHKPHTELLDAIKTTGWVVYIKQVLVQLEQQRGFSAKEIAQHVRGLKPVPGMMRLLRRLGSRPGLDMNILSDANCFFIDQWLDAHALDEIFMTIFTNPAIVLPNGQLLVEPYEEQCHCDQCPQNLCKGSIMKMLINSCHVNYQRIVYIGDSCNDLCAIRSLREHDVACIRHGLELHDKLPAHEHELKCRVFNWRDGHHLEDYLLTGLL